MKFQEACQKKINRSADRFALNSTQVNQLLHLKVFEAVMINDLVLLRQVKRKRRRLSIVTRRKYKRTLADQMKKY